MPIPLKYQRYFLQSTANPGDLITVVTKVYFTSPFFPDINTWFTDIGDNLGGSDATYGPLKNFDCTITTTNLWVSSGILPGKKFLGNGTMTGCMRAWSNGNFSYPMGSGYAEQNYWRPINPSTASVLQITARYLVGANASGQFIGHPSTLVSPSNTNFTPACVMATLGSGFSFQFDYSAPAGASSTLTIN